MMILFGITANLEAKASDYMVNDDEITATFEAAEVDLDLSDVAGEVVQESSSKTTVTKKNKWVAAIIAWALGGLGVHRHYLGTSKGMWAKYTFTCCGILGVVPFIDLIVLIITDDVSQYTNNEDYFMW